MVVGLGRGRGREGEEVSLNSPHEAKPPTFFFSVKNREREKENGASE